MQTSFTTRHKHTIKNTFHSIVLLVSMALLLGGIGFLFFGITGVIWALFFWGLSSLWMPRSSPKWMLHWMGASPLQRWEAPVLYQMVEELSEQAKLNEAPQVYWLSDATPNAFVIGSKKDAYIGVTEGLLQRLNRRQLRAVLAHEISHIQKGDLYVMSVAESMYRWTSILSVFGSIGLFLAAPALLMIGQPLPLLALPILLWAPSWMQKMFFALSQTREFEADRNAALLTRDPLALASALQALEQPVHSGWDLFFERRHAWKQVRTMQTHPPTQERINRLYTLQDGTEKTTQKQTSHEAHTYGARKRKHPRIIDVPFAVHIEYTDRIPNKRSTMRQKHQTHGRRARVQHKQPPHIFYSVL